MCANRISILTPCTVPTLSLSLYHFLSSVWCPFKLVLCTLLIITARFFPHLMPAGKTFQGTVAIVMGLNAPRIGGGVAGVCFASQHSDWTKGPRQRLAHLKTGVCGRLPYATNLRAALRSALLWVIISTIFRALSSASHYPALQSCLRSNIF